MRALPPSIRILGACFLIFVAAAFFGPPEFAQSQSAPTPSRIVQPINESNRVLLTGNTYFLARPQSDAGPAPDSLPMQRMLLVLRRGPAQELALDQLLQDQQNSASPNFHHWLTPQEFGAQFGPSAQDIQTIVSWLNSHGFAVNRISQGATVIEFSGTAGQVRSAFATTIHKYEVNGAEHWANSSDPSIPAALVPVVAGVDTLHNFPRKAMHVVSGVFRKDRSTGAIMPVNPSNHLFTLSCGDGSGTSVPCYGLGPYDFATIYNVLPLWNSSPAIDGTGQTIAVIGESDVDNKDIESFQALFGLPTKDPALITDGPDPGIVAGDETESDLDLEWAGSIAKGATVDFVNAASTDTTLGVDLAAEYAVDQNLAPIISESYGICEAGLGTAGNQFFNSLWQQAAAEGITVLIAAGDSGSAGCDSQDNPAPAPAEYGLQVSGFASTPYDTAVGGTDFNDLSNPTAYWNSTNSSTTQQSAKSYIPEVPWNDTCTSSALTFYGYSSDALTNCNNVQLIPIVVWTVGGSGGKSSCTVGDGADITSCSGGYTKPSWQSGTGVPADGKRDIPDVSFFASAGFYSGSFYVICEADLTNGIFCSSQDGEFLGIGGTSASTPSFAGIMAMVDQKTNSRQGNANYALYHLAAQSGASCTSAASPSASCVFYDVTTGTNAMPCDGKVSSPVNCSSPGAEGIGILTGYNSTAGYDLATGLGSVNAANLASNWSNFAVSLKPSATTLSLSPTTSITHGTPVTVNIGVSAVSPATGTPTGTVALLSTSTLDPSVTSFALTSGSFSGTTNLLPGGTYTVTASYPGDSSFAASQSSPPISITVSPEPSKTAVSVLTQSSTGAISTFTSGAYGSAPLYPRVDVTGNSGYGFPSGTITLLDNGQPINGGLSLTLNSQGNALPTSPIYTFAPGSHSISASYSGDASFNASSSTTSATFTITQAPSDAQPVQFSPTAILLGSQQSFIGVVNTQSCGAPPTGTITFFDNGTQIGTPQTAIGGSGTTCIVHSSEEITSSAFTLGDNAITIKYSGDANYTASTSSPVTLDVQIASTTSLSANPSSSQQGQSVTLTAKVTPTQSGGPVPTGEVEFSTGNNIGTVSLTNGVAQLTTTSLTEGDNLIYAYYNGDVNYSSSSGSASIQVNLGPDFSITFNPNIVNISSPGASGTTTVSVLGSNGFSTPISFAGVTCANLPAESSCSFSPTTVSPGGSTTLTISTTAPSSLAPASRPSLPPSIKRIEEFFSINNPTSLLFLLAVCVFIALQWRRRQWRWLAPALIFALLLVNSACGGGGGGSTGPTNPGTPKVQNQLVSISVTSGTITHQFGFTLNVN